MIRCQTCGAQNIEGSQYCDECGSTLSGGAENNGHAGTPNFRAQIPDAPVFQSTNVTSIGIPAPAFEPELKEKFCENGKNSKGTHAVLIIERGERSGTEFALVADESNIGRWDADNGIFPDVDLDRCDPEAKISRRHARIIRQNGNYLIEDLGSTNGTFVNRGKRLLPGNKNILTDGDELIIGKTFLRFKVNN
ncbi:MAG TPA: FHA domain-containing protein [Pyrinomonadaceae bacterium]|nr:FHA domain-containing protein [Pyrinomonadaceae bacterium]